MHDFDIARHERHGQERAFKIAGTDFRFKPSAGADLLADYYDTLAEPEGPGFNRRVLEAADRLVLGWLEPGQDNLWAMVRDSANPDALTIRDVQDVIGHMTGVLTGRDQGQPSVSSSTPSTPGTKSTDGSPSTAEPSPA